MGGNRATLQTIEKRRYSIASIIKSWKSACVRACVCTAERAPRDPEENSCAHHRHQAVRLGLMTVLDPPDSVVRSMANLCLPSLLSFFFSFLLQKIRKLPGSRKEAASEDSIHPRKRRGQQPAINSLLRALLCALLATGHYQSCARVISNKSPVAGGSKLYRQASNANQIIRSFQLSAFFVLL